MFERVIQLVKGKQPEGQSTVDSLFDAYDAQQVKADAKRATAERIANAPRDEVGHNYQAVADLARGPFDRRDL